MLTKYISVDTEHIISLAVQCSDVDSTLFHIVCCLYSFLNGHDSVSEDLYFVLRFDQIYLFCHWKHHLYVIALQRRWIDALANYMFFGFLIRIWFSVRRFIFCVSFRQNISPLTLNTSFQCHSNAAMLLQHCSHCMLLVFLKRLWFSVGRFIYCVSFWQNISLSSMNT